MHTHLRRASPALLALGAVGLALAGAWTHTLEYTLPAALLLGIAGAAAASRRRPGPTYLVRPLVPTQRTPVHPVLPPPLPGPSVGPDDTPWVTRRAPASRPYLDRPMVGRPARSAVGRPRHCVLPRGEVPHQRRAPGAS